MKLVLDFGNTFTKIGLFCNNDLKDVAVYAKDDLKNIVEYIAQIDSVSQCIISSVANIAPEILKILSRYRSILLDENTDIPIKNLYENSANLGKDRLAAAVAAHHFFPDEPVLVMDAGTCITIDFVDSSGAFRGGAILPGIEMKLNALHNFTQKLPLIEFLHFKEGVQLVGGNTENSILSGVINGTLFELEGFINSFSREYQNINIIISGGDAQYLASKLKNKVVVIPNIVLIGLNQILDFNAKKNKL